MMKIIPKVNFEGYPDDVKTKFRAGVETDVPSDYAKMLEDKDLVEKSRPKPSKPSFDIKIPTKNDRR